MAPRRLNSAAAWLVLGLLGAQAAFALQPSTLIIDPANRQTHYALDAAGVILVSDSDGAAWTPLPNQPWAQLGDLHIDALEPNRLLATSTEGLWLSVDRGESWVRVGPQTDTVALLSSDARSDFVFLAQGEQVFRSSDRGASWQPVARLPVAIEQLAISDANRLHVLDADGTILESLDQGDSFQPDPRFAGLVVERMAVSYCGILAQVGDGFQYASIFRSEEAAMPVEDSLPVASPVVVNRFEATGRPGYDCFYLWRNPDGGLIEWAAQPRTPRVELLIPDQTLADLGASFVPYGAIYVALLGPDGAVTTLEQTPQPTPPCAGAVNRCQVIAEVDRPGFFLFDVGLGPDDDPSTWALEVRGNTVNGFVGGGILLADAGTPGFVSFDKGAGSITLGVEEYLGRLDALDVTLLRIDLGSGSRTAVFGPEPLLVGERTTLEGIDPGFYAAEVRSPPGSPETLFGLELNGDRVTLSGYGGEITSEASGFVGLFGTFSNYRIEFGASRPTISIDYLTPAGDFVPYYPRQAAPPPTAVGTLTPLLDQNGNRRLHRMLQSNAVSGNGRYLAFVEVEADRNLSRRSWLTLTDFSNNQSQTIPLAGTALDTVERESARSEVIGVSSDGQSMLVRSRRSPASDRFTHYELPAVTPGATIEVPELQAANLVALLDNDQLVVEGLPIAKGRRIASELYLLDFATGERRLVGMVPSHTGVGQTQRRVSGNSQGIVAVINSTALWVERIDVRTGTADRYQLTPPQQTPDAVIQLEDVALRPDGAAVLLTVTERFGNLAGIVRSRIFEYEFDAGTWREIAPSTDPLEPHQVRPRYALDGEATFFSREIIGPLPDGGFRHLPRELMRNTDGCVERTWPISSEFVTPRILGGDGSVLSSLTVERATGVRAAMPDFYRWAPEASTCDPGR